MGRRRVRGRPGRGQGKNKDRITTRAYWQPRILIRFCEFLAATVFPKYSGIRARPRRRSPPRYAGCNPGNSRACPRRHDAGVSKARALFKSVVGAPRRLPPVDRQVLIRRVPLTHLRGAMCSRGAARSGGIVPELSYSAIFATIQGVVPPPAGRPGVRPRADSGHTHTIQS